MGKAKANGAAIRVIRERSDLSVSDVVAAMGAEGVEIHADHLRNIELGYRQPSPKVLGALARALRVPKVAILAAVPDEQVPA
jgi:transcriptional regulator with XRE-family HTH domain